VELVIERKFRGPTGSANGGYTCGLLASFMHGPAEVTLRLPPPLERPLEVVTDGALELRDGEQLVAEAAPTGVDLDVPEAISFEDAAAAELPDGDRESASPSASSAAGSEKMGCGSTRVPSGAASSWRRRGFPATT
jgi:hypothetical protein